MKTPAQTWAAAVTTQPAADIMRWWVLFSTYMFFELGALSALVEGLSDAERQAAAGEAVRLVADVVKKGKRAKPNKNRRYRSNVMLRLLRTSSDKEFLVPALSPTKRNAKLEDFVKVQTVAVDIAITTVESLGSTSDAAERSLPQPIIPPLKNFGNFICQRKMH